MDRAILVARSMSLEAPVEMSSSIRLSAIRPPSRVQMFSSISFLVMYMTSFSGRLRVKPPAPPRGMMETWWTLSWVGQW